MSSIKKALVSRLKATAAGRAKNNTEDGPTEYIQDKLDLTQLNKDFWKAADLLEEAENLLLQVASDHWFEAKAASFKADKKKLEAALKEAKKIVDKMCDEATDDERRGYALKK